MPAAYYRKYRAANAQYRERERERSRLRREERGRGDRSEEYKRRNAKEREQRKRASGDNGRLLESKLVQKAKELATSKRQPDRRAALHDPIHEDLVGVALLALCEGKDPGEAMNVWLKSEYAHRYHTAPLVQEGGAAPVPQVP